MPWRWFARLVRFAGLVAFSLPDLGGNFHRSLRSAGGKSSIDERSGGGPNSNQMYRMPPPFFMSEEKLLQIRCDVCWNNELEQI